jgi:hypothetical protein
MVGIIKNLFGGKNNYYAELNEEQASKTAESQHTEPQAASTAASPVKEEAKEEAPTPQPQSQPMPTAAAPSAPAPVQNSNQPPENPLAGETFAPTYLIPKSTMPRRRPGVNMGQFLDMAREVQVPRNQ